MKYNLIILFTCLILITSKKKQKTIYLIRHGETNFNTDPTPRVRGRINVPLNELGIAHCKAAGDFLANENIGKIYYSSVPRAKHTAEIIAAQHSSKVDLVEEPLVIDISWGDWEGKTYKEAMGSEDGGEFFTHIDNVIVPNGEGLYAVLDRTRKFLERFWQSDEEVCTIATHGTNTNLFATLISQSPIDKFWTWYMSACGVSKIIMKDISDYQVKFWNANFFLKDGEKKYLKPKL